ncbi:MAG: IS21 family transposase [Spirochaetia bacterium]|nr:IS21 family transposase [Spirochaetia bacterium]
MNEDETLKMAALKSGMDEKTARKYLRQDTLPEDRKKVREWKTRKDPFDEVNDVIDELMELNEGLEAKTIFEELKKRFPDKFHDGQLRTLQRKIKIWRATKGRAKKTIFPQKHEPGKLGASDFTNMNSLGITIQGRSFNHLIYHFVLTYSNWETGSICFSESFESLSEGLQNALWRLGAVPQSHRTDRLSAAVNNSLNRDEFTKSYQNLLDHYGLKGEKINPGNSNENGDVEQSHFRFKKAMDQSLMLRGSRNFDTVESYKIFVIELFEKLNKGRGKRLKEEYVKMQELPAVRLNDCKEYTVKVGPSSVIHVGHHTYSVHSRLIRETVKARLYADRIEVWYAGRKVDEMPRKHGENGHSINYRHIIDWLVRKPGAFENYIYRESLFPTSYFRMAYDMLMKEQKRTVEYLKILHMAAHESESSVNSALRILIESGTIPTESAVKAIVMADENNAADVHVEDVNLSDYDSLVQEAL